MCLLAAAAAGVVAIDSICADIRNLELVEAEAQAAKGDGFAAKALIHPSHIEIVNRVFSPSAEDLAWAEHVLQAFEQRPDLGVINDNGNTIDKQHERMRRE